MKKCLLFLVSLLSISSLAVFAGCSEKGNGSDTSIPGNVSRMITQDVGEDETPDEVVDDGCPDDDCHKSMPKIKFGHKHGRPTSKHAETEGHGSHRVRHGRHHKNPRPAPPEDDEERGDNN